METRILYLLYINPSGLGYNELKAEIYEKSLRAHLPKLLRENWIKIEPKLGRGGIKNVHLLTDEGKKEVRLRELKESMVGKVYKMGGFHTRQQKLDLFSELVADVCLLCYEELKEDSAKVLASAFTKGLNLAVETKKRHLLNLYDDVIALCKKRLEESRKKPLG